VQGVGNFDPFCTKSAWQRPLRYRKRGPDRSSTPKKLSFDVKIAKIGSADLEIIFSEKSLKKIKKKKKEIMEGKTYSPVGHLAERAKIVLMNLCTGSTTVP